MYLYKYSLCIQFTDNLHLIHFNTCIKIPMFFTLYSVEKKDDNILKITSTSFTDAVYLPSDHPLQETGRSIHNL